MVKTTRLQREALFKVFQRDFPRWLTPTKRLKDYQRGRCPYTAGELAIFAAERHPDVIVPVPSIQYRRFRKTVQPGPGCIMVQWRGMWLGIEPDGYTHS